MTLWYILTYMGSYLTFKKRKLYKGDHTDQICKNFQSHHKFRLNCSGKCALCLTSAWSCSSSFLGSRLVFSSFFSVWGRHRSRPQWRTGPQPSPWKKSMIQRNFEIWRKRLRLTACQQVRCTCSMFEIYKELIVIVVRSMEHSIFPQRGKPDNKRQPPGHHSPFEEAVEGLLRFQVEQV